ncbi:MAG TPA: DEAD/DEAH box helicase [Steroidobacteraceae bacterium]|nr:DEAD/DEAH box helicase [Steroidobacteraceae bacterium]
MSAVPADESPNATGFRDLALPEPLLRALADVGYESPSPIQAATIPVLLAGADMLGQAQTGTGKTAAFALPALARIDLSKHDPQVLVLVPTRELALQVAEAFLKYAAHLQGFHVLPIYGGQSYQPQLNALRRGVHVVVGTPGRVIDHMNRGTLKLAGLTMLVLDEADEMLHMGFVDAVESILEQTPPQRQVALFSATLPAPIRRIAAKHLRSPVEVTIKSKTSTATNIRQRYWMVSGIHKLDALTRILEAEDFDGMLVFTRTKQATVELAEKLEARGFSAAPLNGDIPQPQRERTVARLKAGQIDILVATDVAARGLDVERIGHVVNYDVPYDTESYVHRIGRTGRAGRKGEAILFIAPRERNMLRAIERATRQVIEPMNLPTVDAVNTLRIAKFKQRIVDTMPTPQAAALRPIVEQLEAEIGMPLIDIAAALASLSQGSTPLLLAGKPERERPATAHEYPPSRGHAPAREYPPPPRERAPAREYAPPPRDRAAAQEHAPARDHAPPPRERAPARERDAGPAFDGARKARAKSAGHMETFRIEVGSVHGIKPGNVVGAIANEAGIEGVHIGRVDIREDHSFVDLPEGMPKEIFKQLQKVRVTGRELRISRVSEKPPKAPRDTAGRHPAARDAPRKMLSRRNIKK